MESNWVKTIELIAMCMGGAIVVLGGIYFIGIATISPALVTGISIAGFCLTLSDSIIKMDIGHKKFIKSESTQILLVGIMHFIAVSGIILFPNSAFIYIGKENLDFISTFASVTALGFVIWANGNNNRKEVINEVIKQNQLLIDNQDNIKELKRDFLKVKKELKQTKVQLLQSPKEVEKVLLQS
ncbi:hypothetical protein [Bacillus mycoides]|uniref:hypothetical protein n=1 Tax=Bacillus mycoides TaxID=1405 RepID=UPI00077B184B|nr:hypothetical protein [Bacillus mycoides]KXY47523.1 hypothetical protein AT257_02270 [Bacillus cereus]QEL84934.1 hypothetical protein DN409_11210 [Bacillus mycoides]QWH00745.1 hypothetical protein EXW52_11230 [Bacillus mycoides]